MRKSCHLICGQDDYLVEAAARRLVDAVVPLERREFGLEVIDGRVETVDACVAVLRQTLEALVSDSLFGGGEKLVWLREPAFLTIDRIGRSTLVKPLVEALVDQVKTGLAAGDTLLVTTLQVNRSTTFFKAFKSHGEVQDHGTGLNLRQRQGLAAKALDDLLPEKGLQMDRAVRGEFLARVGADVRVMANELEKLRCYLGAAGTVRGAEVQAIVSPGQEGEIWDVLDAFSLRQAPQFIRALRLQMESVDTPIALVTMLERRLNDLILVREALDRKWAQAGGGQGGIEWRGAPGAIESWMEQEGTDLRRMNPYRVQHLVRQASCWRLQELRWARHTVIELREALVSSNLPPKWLAEVQLLKALRLTGRRAQRPAAR